MKYGVKINGRNYFVNSEICEIKEIGSGRFTVTYDRAEFQVTGGRKSGGYSHEWFVRNELFLATNGCLAIQ